MVLGMPGLAADVVFATLLTSVLFVLLPLATRRLAERLTALGFMRVSLETLSVVGSGLLRLFELRLNAARGSQHSEGQRQERPPADGCRIRANVSDQHSLRMPRDGSANHRRSSPGRTVRGTAIVAHGHERPWARSVRGGVAPLQTRETVCRVQRLAIRRARPGTSRRSSSGESRIVFRLPTSTGGIDFRTRPESLEIEA